jgi:hypothetical protein
MFLNKKFLLFVILTLIGASVFLANRDIPAPQQKVEKVVSNDRFFK